jgi:hypothetical protein
MDAIRSSETSVTMDQTTQYCFVKVIFIVTAIGTWIPMRNIWSETKLWAINPQLGVILAIRGTHLSASDLLVALWFVVWTRAVSSFISQEAALVTARWRCGCACHSFHILSSFILRLLFICGTRARYCSLVKPWLKPDGYTVICAWGICTNRRLGEGSY